MQIDIFKRGNGNIALGAEGNSIRINENHCRFTCLFLTLVSKTRVQIGLPCRACFRRQSFYHSQRLRVCNKIEL